MKTVKEWFEEQPEPRRSVLLMNMDIELVDNLSGSIWEALNFGISWYFSNYGYDYWFNIHKTEQWPIELMSDEEKGLTTQSQSAIILEQKEKIEQLEIEVARLTLKLRNLNAPTKPEKTVKWTPKIGEVVYWGGNNPCIGVIRCKDTAFSNSYEIDQEHNSLHINHLKPATEEQIKMLGDKNKLEI
jgi:hypothetical protein